MSAFNRLSVLKKAVDSLERWLFSFPTSESGLNVTRNKAKSSADTGAETYSATNTDTGADVDPDSSANAPDVSGETSAAITEEEADRVLADLEERLKGNYPFHSSVYAGQMLKPPHDIAWAAYALTMLINPNNHALDGGPPTSEMEKEVIPRFASMFGFSQPILGHLTSSGTIANLEALWVARSIHPGKAIAFSGQAHYTHERMCGVLNMQSIRIPTNEDGRWDLDYLRAVGNGVGTLVVTMGTTGAGRVEPLHEILPVARELGIRIHLDAAYGGYFKLLQDTGYIENNAWKFTSEADSIVIDPHKHGLQPYGCGCVLFKDPAVGRFYKHDSPYTYFSSEELHLGEISLECSRAGAAAAALWATMQVFQPEPGGRMADIMRNCVLTARNFAAAIDLAENFVKLEDPQLDIVIYAALPATGIHSLSEISAACERVFKNGMNKGAEGIFVSLYTVTAEQVLAILPDFRRDAEKVTVLRSVFMKPEQLGFVDELVSRLEACR